MPEISADGRFVVFMTNDPAVLRASAPDCSGGGKCNQIMRYAIGQATTVPVSTLSGGRFFDSGAYIRTNAVSADGNHVVFIASVADRDQPDVFFHDGFLKSFEPDQLTALGGESITAGWGAQISADGQRVVFEGSGPLDPQTPGPYDFVYALRLGEEPQPVVSQQRNPERPIFPSLLPAISANGRWIVFYSYASLTADDMPCDPADPGGGACGDLFRFDTVEGSLTRLEMGLTDRIGEDMYPPEVADSGRWVFLGRQVLEFETGERFSLYAQYPRACGVRLASASNALVFINPDDRFVYRFDLATRRAERVRDVSGSDGSAALDLAGCDTTYSEALFSYSDDLTAIAFATTERLNPQDRATCPSLGVHAGSCSDIYLWRAGQPELTWVSGPAPGNPPAPTPSVVPFYPRAGVSLAGVGEQGVLAVGGIGLDRAADRHTTPTARRCRLGVRRGPPSPMSRDRIIAVCSRSWMDRRGAETIASCGTRCTPIRRSAASAWPRPRRTAPCKGVG